MSYSENNNFIKTGIIIGMLVISLFFVGCEKRKKRSSLDGIWKQDGYGRILEIKNSNYCSSLTKGILTDRFKIIELNGDSLILNIGDISDYKFYRSQKIPLDCKEPSRIKKFSSEYVFRIFWEIFNEHYAFFDKRKIDWDSIYKTYSNSVENINSEEELYSILKEITDIFQDGHIKLVKPEKEILNNNKNLYFEQKESLKQNILNKYVVERETYNRGVMEYGKVKNSSIGYIQISSMKGFSDYNFSRELTDSEYIKGFKENTALLAPIKYLEKEENDTHAIMKKALSQLQNSTSIVIDLRFNGGGYDKVALALLSHFINEKKHILSKYARIENEFTKKQEIKINPQENGFDGQVYVLIGPSTASAAEVFALGALSCNNMILVGGNTNGIFSEILWKELPNGWEIGLSNEIYEDPDGTQYENSGIPPSINLQYSKEWNEFYNSFFTRNDFEDIAIEKVIDSEKTRP